MARLEYEEKGDSDLVNVLRQLELSLQPSHAILNFKAVILARLGFGEEAFTIFSQLVNDSKYSCNNIAEYNLGICYREGIGCNKDFKKSKSHLLQAMETDEDGYPNFGHSYFALGYLYYIEGETDTAKDCYDKVMKFDPDYACAAKLNMAILLHTKDKERIEAAQSILKEHNGCIDCHEANAYDKNARLCPKCQFLSLKEDLFNNKPSLISTLSLPARQGYAGAQYFLGKRLLMKKNRTAIAEAIKWLTLSAEQNYVDAQKLLITLFPLGVSYLPEEVSEYNSLVRWSAIYANNSMDASTEYLLYSLLHEYALKDAYKWLGKAAKNGSADAQKELNMDLKVKKSENAEFSSKLPFKAVRTEILNANGKGETNLMVDNDDILSKSDVKFEPFGIYAAQTGVRKAMVNYARGFDKNGVECFKGFVEMTHVGKVKTQEGFVRRAWVSTIPITKQYGKEFEPLVEPTVATFKDGRKVLFDRTKNTNNEIDFRTNLDKKSVEEIKKYLEDNGVKYFYHFTDERNLDSIKRTGGLYSWHHCEKNNIKISFPGGDESSRMLDRKFRLEDYVRLSFCEDHPMAYRLRQKGYNLVLLQINIDVIFSSRTLFSDINAADKNHIIGGGLNALKRIDIPATKEKFVSKDSPIFKKHQAEVLVETFIPLKDIVNIDNPTPICDDAYASD